MTVQRPWMQAPPDQPCEQCRRLMSGRTTARGSGVYDHVHQVNKVPQRRIANRQWVRTAGWAVECSCISAWVFFVELDAAVAFARAAMGTDDLGAIDLRHAYTEEVFPVDRLGPSRKFLGLAGAATRLLFNDRLLQSWIDTQVPDQAVLARRAS